MATVPPKVVEQVELANRSRGLQNLGNTCFMNSGLQCLLNIPPLRDALLSDDSWEPGSIYATLAPLVRHMWARSPGVDAAAVNPDELKKATLKLFPTFEDYEQQDAMEFLELLINALVEGTSSDDDQSAEKRAPFPTGDAVARLLGGFFQTELRCPRCSKEWFKDEPFFSIRLPSHSPRCERDDFTVIVISQPSSLRPILEHRVAVPKPAKVCRLLDVIAPKAEVDRELCLVGVLEDGKWRHFEEDHELLPGHLPVLVYELEDTEALRAFHGAVFDDATARAGSDAERRVCPDDGKVYTFPELLAAYSSDYSPSDLRAYWRDAMAPEFVKAGKKSPVVVHVRVNWNLGRKLLGVPLLFCMDTQTHMEMLIDAIQVQLMLRYNLDATDWSLFQSSAGWDALHAETQLRSNGLVTLRDCEHLVLHWDFPPASLLTSSIQVTAPAVAKVEESLLSCFQWLTDAEQLDEENGLFCEPCERKVEAFSKVSLALLPPVLMLQLKRFDFRYGQRHRLNDAVSFPLEGLELTHYRSSPEMLRRLVSSQESGKSEPLDMDVLKEMDVTYDLLGTITHSGTASVGHYQAYVRSCEDGHWYLYNDDLVRRASCDEVRADTRGSYVLFYLSRALRPTSWKEPFLLAT